MPSKKLALSDDQALELAELFRLVGDASRLKIVIVCLDKAHCVSEIAAKTKLSPSLVSHHLRLLRAARMLRAERRGKKVFYISTDEHVRCVITDMIDHITEGTDD
jgi:DNA-binding transcriptional ArsR family regulator